MEKIKSKNAKIKLVCGCFVFYCFVFFYLSIYFMLMPQGLILAFAKSPSVEFADVDECLSCHSSKTLTKKSQDNNDENLSLYVDFDILKQTAHENKKCVDCHKDIKIAPDDERVHGDTATKTVNCIKCHYKGNVEGAPQYSPMDDYQDSIHGIARLEKKEKQAPICKDCHGTHDIFPKTDLRSKINPTNLPSTCARCHADRKLIEKFKDFKVFSVKKYLKSVHGQALTKSGLTIAAVCNDCHGIHNIKMRGDKESTVSRYNIPKTCAKCHSGIYKDYIQSVHGRDLVRGNKDVPVCTTCHGEHTIKPLKDTTSPVYPTHISKTCSHCHDDVKLTAKYNLPNRREKTYIGSYHGTAAKYGDIHVANCASCHGAHNIKMATEPTSTINPKNLPKTCGKCHPGAGRNFAIGKVHVEATKENNAGVYYVRRFYTYFIVFLIGGFVGYIFIDVISRRRRKSR